MAKQRRKSRWALDRAGAVSLIEQARRALLGGQPSTDPTRPPTISIEIPAGVASYLIDAFAQISAGVNANDALGLKNNAGARSKEIRNALLAIDVDELRATGTKRDDALLQIGSKYRVMELKTAETAYSNAKIAPNSKENEFGQSLPDFYRDINETFGDEVASDFLDFLKSRHRT